MYGEDAGYVSQQKCQLSQDHNYIVDAKVKEILNESKARVTALLQSKEEELRNISRNLYWFDYLDSGEIDKVMKGKQLQKKKVRDWDLKKANGG